METFFNTLLGNILSGLVVLGVGWWVEQKRRRPPQ